MSTLLAGILIIGGTGLIICGGLYLLFKLIDKRHSSKLNYERSKLIQQQANHLDLEPPQPDLIRIDTINILSPKGSDWP